MSLHNAEEKRCAREQRKPRPCAAVQLSLTRKASNLLRLRRIEARSAVCKDGEEDRRCPDILMQVASVQEALKASHGSSSATLGADVHSSHNGQRATSPTTPSTSARRLVQACRLAVFFS